MHYSAQIAGQSAELHQIAGLRLMTCTPQPATSTFENLFPFNPTTSNQIFPNPVTTSPSNNGLAKVDYSPNEHHHFDGFFYISRETTSGGQSIINLTGALWVSGSTEEYAGAWTWTPNSRWVNDLRGGARPTQVIRLRQIPA